MGKHIIKVCHGTACHVSGATGITEAIAEELNVPVGGTTEDDMFTLDSVAGLGCCSLAPVMMIDETTYEKLNRAKAPKMVRGEELLEPAKETSQVSSPRKRGSSVFTGFPLSRE